MEYGSKLKRTFGNREATIGLMCPSGNTLYLHIIFSATEIKSKTDRAGPNIQTLSVQSICICSCLSVSGMSVNRCYIIFSPFVTFVWFSNPYISRFNQIAVSKPGLTA